MRRVAVEHEEAVGGLVVQRVGADIDHRVDQAAGSARTMAAACRSAGCTSGFRPQGSKREGHHEAVGAGLDAVGQALVEADLTAICPGKRSASSRKPASMAPCRCYPAPTSCARQCAQPSPTVSSRSRPFWWVSRLMTPNSGRSAVIFNPISALQRRLVSALGG